LADGHRGGGSLRGGANSGVAAAKIGWRHHRGWRSVRRRMNGGLRRMRGVASPKASLDIAGMAPGARRRQQRNSNGARSAASRHRGGAHLARGLALRGINIGATQRSAAAVEHRRRRDAAAGAARSRTASRALFHLLRITAGTLRCASRLA